MGLLIKDDEVERLARDLARSQHLDVTETIRLALEAYAAAHANIDLWTKLKPLRDELDRAGHTGRTADKAFYDQLSGEA